MFDFDPGNELSLVIETARKFADAELRPQMRAAEAQRALAPSVHEAYGAIGLAGLELPEHLGGTALGPVARVLVNEELAAADPGGAIALDPFGLALYPVLEADEQSLLATLAGETDGVRSALVSDQDADLRIDAKTVSGRVPWLPANELGRIVILGEREALCIESGFESQPLRGAGLRAAGGCELRFDAAPIALRFGDAASCERARARARIYVAALLLGVMRHACDFSREYARERHAFGRPIAHHQALAFLITDMQMALDGARLLVHEAAWRLESGRRASAEAAAAYAQCIEASRLIGPNGVQILGGHGFMADYPMEKTMREARALGLMLGGMDAAVEEAGQALCAADLPIELGALETL
jgi:alkylation response protein AidB-like acyl-CoA dehydrogenase